MNIIDRLTAKGEGVRACARALGLRGGRPVTLAVATALLAACGTADGDHAGSTRQHLKHITQPQGNQDDACILGAAWTHRQTLGAVGGKQVFLTSAENDSAHGRLILGAYDIERESDAAKFDIYRQDASGRFVLDYVWDPGPDRVLWTGRVTTDPRGGSWAMVSDCDGWPVDSADHDCRITILKRHAFGTWSTRLVRRTDRGTMFSIANIVAREIHPSIGPSHVELWANGAGYAGPLKRWMALRYDVAASALTEFDVVPYTGVYAGLSDDNLPEPNFMRLSPNGRFWIGARVEDNLDDVHALLMEENAESTGFDIVLDYRIDPIPSQPGLGDQDSGDRFRDVAFDDSGNFYLIHSYWYPYGSQTGSRLHTYSEVFKGRATNPADFTVLEKDNDYFPGGTTLYWTALWASHARSHDPFVSDTDRDSEGEWSATSSSTEGDGTTTGAPGELFLAGMAFDDGSSASPVAEVSFVRRGGASGPFTASDAYFHVRSGGDVYTSDYVQDVLVGDNDQNVWHFFLTDMLTDTGHLGVNSQTLIEELACQPLSSPD